jgi:hypothetical protein
MIRYLAGFDCCLAPFDFSRQSQRAFAQADRNDVRLKQIHNQKSKIKNQKWRSDDR